VFRKDVRSAVLRLADIFSAENAAWEEMTTAATSRCQSEDGRLRAGELRQLGVAAQRRVILAWLRSQRVPDCGLREVDGVRQLLAPGNRTSRFNLPGATRACRRNKELFLREALD